MMSSRKSALITSGCLAASLAVLTGCAALPDRSPPEAGPPRAISHAAEALAAPIGQWPLEQWWRAYQDEQLDTVIATALAGAPSLKVARARLDQARASTGVARSALSPQIQIDASVTQQKQSANFLSPPSVTPLGYNDYGRLTADFSFDLDLWGRLRAGLAAATSEADATEADLAQARLLLATSIATGWSELARLGAALDTASAAVTVRSRTAELLAQRFAFGLETRASVRQADARRASAVAEQLMLQEQIALQRNRIAALAGQGPDEGLKLQRPSVAMVRAFALPDALPAELLGRRPDITAARRRIEASQSRVDAAEAAFYPDINLLAFIGVQSIGLQALSRSGSTIGSIGPAVSLPVFSGGRLRSQLRGADAALAEAIADYERTVVTALQEVADVATSQRALTGQLTQVSDATEASRESWVSLNERYRGGLASYLEVLSAEDLYLANRRSESDLQSRSFGLDVALVRALGGGYRTPRT